LPDIAQLSIGEISLSILTEGASLTISFSETSKNVAHTIWVSLNHFDVIGPPKLPNSVENRRLTQNNSHYADQGYSGSPILVYQSKARMRLPFSD